jgi:hypothetical protein
LDISLFHCFLLQLRASVCPTIVRSPAGQNPGKRGTIAQFE